MHSSSSSSSSSIISSSPIPVPVPVPVLSLCPSLNSYSSINLSQIDQHQQTTAKPPQDEQVNTNNDDDDDDNDEFEFAFVSKHSNDSSPISADEIFHNGQIRPTFPILNTDFFLDKKQLDDDCKASKPPRLPLGKLLIEERHSQSCSSSEADDLDGVAPGTYCVWTPKDKQQGSPRWCKKSNSTGSSKRWKFQFQFRDLLHRSNSEGKDSFVFLAPSNSIKKEENFEKVAGQAKAKGVVVVDGAGEVERKRSYFPYRQDLVGLFANVSGMRRNPNLHPYP